MTDDIFILPDRQPTRADALKNHALLLDTARQLFDEFGVEAVSMSAIAEAAGVGKGTLYRHFENKPALCQALLDAEQRSLQERTLEHLRSHSDAQANLRWFIGEVILFVDCFNALLSVGEVGLSTLEHPAHWWWRQTIYGLLVQIGPNGDVDYLADALYVLLDTYTLRFQRRVRGYPLDRIHAGLLHTLDLILTKTD